MKKTVVLLAALMLALAGCGGSSGDDKKAAENISKSIREDSDAISQKDADCFAEKVVDNVGVDSLKKYGVLDDDLAVKDDVENVKMSEDDAEGAADAFTDCIDFDKFFSEALGDDLGDEVVDCLKEAINEDKYHDLMKATFQGDQAAATEAMSDAAACMTQ